MRAGAHRARGEQIPVWTTVTFGGCPWRAPSKPATILAPAAPPSASPCLLEPPTLLTVWEGELDATSYTAQAPQLFGLLEKALGASSIPAAGTVCRSTCSRRGATTGGAP